MKRITKIFSCLLVLVLVLSAVPVRAEAAEAATATVTIEHHYGEVARNTSTVVVGAEPVTLYEGGYVELSGNYYHFTHYSIGGTSVTIPAYDGSDAWLAKYGRIIAYYEPHTHKYVQMHNRTHHWMGCACGKSYDKFRHVDPAKDEDKVCSCGYIFSSNCDLSTLWLENMVLTEPFDREVTDYTADVHTYKEVKATRIAAHTYDAMAKVELPKNLSIQDGSTVFQVKVTAEDTVTTKTYTVTAIKPTKVAGVLIENDGTSVMAHPKTKTVKTTATAKVPELLVEKMAEMAAESGSRQIVLDPKFSKWGCKQIDVTLPGSVLKTIAEDTDAELLISTHFGDVHIPNADVETLAKDCETFTVSIIKEEDISLLVNGEKLKDIPEGVYRDLY